MSDIFVGRTYYGEQGYLNLLHDTLTFGVHIENDRTQIGTLNIFNAQIHWDLAKDFPFCTHRPAPLRMAFEELWFFLRGQTDTKILEEKGINFWKGNTSREFLDSRGLTHLREGDLGRAYSKQFREYNGCVDQLKNVWYGLLNDPYSRRHHVTLWNPAESHLMALTPCWYAHTFMVTPPKNGGDPVLHMKLHNRGVDLSFGALFSIAGYALYQLAMAESLGYDVGYLVADMTNVHIYRNQIDYVKETLQRDLGKAGKVSFRNIPQHYLEILDMEWEDIIVEGLEVNTKPFVTQRPPMAV